MQDFERTKVPQSKTVRWYHIALIYTGVAITIPAFLLIANIAISLGYKQAALAVLLSCLILSFFGVITGAVGAKTNLSSYMIISQVFGEKGSKLINVLFAITLSGWFGVTLSFFAQAANNIIPLGYQLWLIIGTVLMSLTAIYGIKGLHLFSLISVPIMLLFLYGFSLTTLHNTSFLNLLSIQGNNSISLGTAISMLVGGLMVGVAIFPDLTRYTKSVKDGIIAGVASFMSVLIFALPIMIPILYYQQTNIVEIVENISYAWIALFLIVFASWSSNDNNLYSGALSLAPILKNVSKNKIVLAIALLGYLCSALNITDNFITFLMFLSAIIPPISAIYCVDLLFIHTQKKNYKINKIAFCSWFAGIFLAILTTPAENNGLGYLVLTTIPALDGYLIAGLTYYLASYKKIK